jgi:predicted nuclease of predicted toxin-antitoxin system
VKLLFDQNLSFRLARSLEDRYPGSAHVRDVGLAAADDQAVWDHASREAFTIVSRDSDFHLRSLLLGSPPRVIWIRRGNCSTAEAGALLRQREEEIRAFHQDPEAAFLVLE